MTRTGNGSNFDLNRFKKASALGIIRGATPSSVNGALEACVSGGLQFVEFTLNSEGALSFIEAGSKDFSDSLCIGAGTVLSVSEASQAFSAGAQFIVSPTLNDDVASYCRDNGLAYFPGALTPTEIEKAWNAGAAMVKVFPASQMGADYLKILRGPFSDILLMAVGGVHASNADEFLRAGASAVAIGGSVLSPVRMRNEEFDTIRKEISEFVLAVRAYYSRIS